MESDALIFGHWPVPGKLRVVTDRLLLLKSHQISDATFERAKSRFGSKGVVDMTGIVGYYTFLAMQLNAAQYPIPKESKKLPRISR